MPNAAIEIKNLNYSYKTDWLFKKVPALKDINLEIREGEAFGYLGPNGAGKTTTIKCILGLIKPQKGGVKIFGIDSRSPTARKVVGYLPEQPYFYDHLTVRELVEMYACLAGVSRGDVAEFAAQALEKVKLSDRSGSRMRTLSKGLTQRVAMAQALVAKPKLLILDEPFSGLDPIGRKELRELIINEKAAGATIFMSSHILSDIEFLCNRASIAVRGELRGIFDLKDLRAAEGTTFELIVQDVGKESDYVHLSKSLQKESGMLRMTFSDRENAVQALKITLDCGAAVESFTPHHAGLEEQFVKLIEGGGGAQ